MKKKDNWMIEKSVGLCVVSGAGSGVVYTLAAGKRGIAAMETAVAVATIFPLAVGAGGGMIRKYKKL